MATIPINDSLSLDEGELELVASRSGCPGGQNVNKVNSRVTLRFDVVNSPSLSSVQRARILERLAGRITREGVLWVHAQDHRTQGGNRRAAVARLADLLRGALHEAAPRRATRAPRSVNRRRLEHKRRRAQLKRLRGGRHDGRDE